MRAPRSTIPMATRSSYDSGIAARKCVGRLGAGSGRWFRDAQSLHRADRLISNFRHLLIKSMPFTIAHSAVALPVLRWLRAPYAASALVVGTMAPDFEYFLRLRPFASISHTLPGLLVFCLPAGAAVLAAFH